MLFLAHGCDVSRPSVRTFMDAVDNDIMSTFEEVMGVPLSRPQRLQASLPMRKGGCGIKLLRTYAPAAHLAFLAAHGC